MFGKDIERILKGIDSVKNAAANGVVSLANATAYRITSKEQHAGTAFGVCYPLEEPVPDGDPMSSVISALESIRDDLTKMNELRNNLYIGYKEFNNLIGSPWDELDKLEEAVDNGKSYSGAHAPFNYVGEKAGMLSILNMIISAAIDAKWALVIYQDYIQRGYDHLYNDNKPSIEFDSGLDKESTGNIIQDYEENVNVEKPSNDPF